MPYSKTLRRPYDEIMRDLATVRELLLHPEQATAGDKSVKFNMTHLERREAKLMQEASRYDANGNYRGPRWYRGNACD